MKKIFARPRSLLVIIALVMIATMSTISTARAASSSPGTGNAAGVQAASSAQCNLRHTISKCESTDPTVTLSTLAYGGTGNTVDCTFVWDINWGDGHSATATEINPPRTWKTISQHTYAATPKTYTVTATGTASAGCTLNPFVVTFTLLAPVPPPNYNCSCVTYVRDVLAANGVTLNGGPATASGYTEKWMNAHGWHRVKLLNNGTIPDRGKPVVMVWDANKKGAFGAGHMAIVVTAWSRTNLGASGKSPWYNHKTKVWNITVMQVDWAGICSPAQHFFSSWGNLSGVNFYVPNK